VGSEEKLLGNDTVTVIVTDPPFAELASRFVTLTLSPPSVLSNGPVPVSTSPPADWVHEIDCGNRTAGRLPSLTVTGPFEENVEPPPAGANVKVVPLAGVTEIPSTVTGPVALNTVPAFSVTGVKHVPDEPDMNNSPDAATERAGATHGDNPGAAGLTVQLAVTGCEALPTSSTAVIAS
jgi:hypothetical protein